MRKDAQVPSAVGGAVGGAVRGVIRGGCFHGCSHGCLGGCLVVSALDWGLGRQGANKGAIQGPEWRKKIERKASGSLNKKRS
jgi:hypothetical protein